MARLLAELDNGELVPLDAIGFGQGLSLIKKTLIKDAIQKYLDNVTALKCVENHKREKLYLTEFFALLKVEFLGQITLADAENYQRRLLFRGLKASTVERRFQVINHFFEKCIDWEYLMFRPSKKLKRLKIEKNPRKVWPDEALEKVFKALSSPYKEYLLFMYLTGARQKEINNLRWPDIDYEEKQVIFKSKKNKGTARTFPITPEIDTVLHNLKMLGTFVFSRHGKKMSTDSVYQAVKHRLKALGYNNLVPNGLRHTFANRLSKQGVNAFYIQKLLGHVDIRTTLNYVNPDKKDLYDALTNIKTIKLIKAN